MVVPTVISTFAGTGGSSLGYKWAGFEELLAIDFDAHAVQCFKANFPEVPVWHKSVLDVTGQQILDFCKLKRGDLDVFDGSPPCQGFSTAGKRQVNDPRNDLFKAYVRLIEDLGPKVFVMENVTGMAKGKMKGRFIEIMKTLKALPYRVKCKQMNAKYYGVPQSRERLIFIGVREDLGIDPVYPVAASRLIPIKSVLSGCPKDQAPFIVTGKCLEFAKKLKPGQSGQDISKDGSWYGMQRLHNNKPSPTIRKNGGLWQRYASYIHPTETRSLTVAEVKRLCTFPDKWNLGDDKIQAWERLGNAVMPKFMQAIAETIRTEILDRHYRTMVQ